MRFEKILKLETSFDRFLERKRSKLKQLKSTFCAKKFHTEVVLVYLQPFRRISRLNFALQLKIAKNN